MELDLSLFCSRMCVDVLHSYYLRHKSNNLNEFLHLVDLNRVDYLLLQKLGEPGVDFCLQFGVFEEKGLELMCKDVNEVFGPGILHWHLHRPCPSAEVHEDSS